MTRRADQISVSSPLGPPQSAPWLGLTGALMLLVAFALFNDWFGFADERWPWDLLSNGGMDLYSQTLLVAWLTTGLWALALAFTPTRRVRAVGCALLGGILLTATLRDGHPLLTHAGGTDVFFLLTMATFGAGLLLTRDPSTCGRGRLLAGVGGLLFLWILALPLSRGGPSPLCLVFEDFVDIFGDHTPSAERLLGYTVPFLLLVIAALGAVLAALGLTGRRLLLVWFFVLLGARLLSTGTAVAASSFDGIEDFAATLTTTVITHGLLLWLFVLFTIRDLGRWTRS